MYVSRRRLKRRDNLANIAKVLAPMRDATTPRQTSLCRFSLRLLAFLAMQIK